MNMPTKTFWSKTKIFELNSVVSRFGGAYRACHNGAGASGERSGRLPSGGHALHTRLFPRQNIG